MQSFVSIICVLEKVRLGDKVVGSTTPLICKLLDIVMREINRAAILNKSFLDAETKAVFSKKYKMGNKITSNSCLGLRAMLDKIGDCPEKCVWEPLSFSKGKHWIFFVCLWGSGNSKKHLNEAILM